MAAMADYLEQELIKHIFRTGSFTKPTILGVALYTAAPSDTGGGTEATGGSYAREDTPPLDANWAAPGVGGLTDNVAAITFTTATASWGTISHTAILDNTTGGNFLFHGALTASKTVDNGDTFKFNIGDFDVTLA